MESTIVEKPTARNRSAGGLFIENSATRELTSTPRSFTVVNDWVAPDNSKPIEEVCRIRFIDRRKTGN